MPISFDLDNVSYEELSKMCISLYENKLRKNLKIDNETLSILLDHRRSNCRYLNITIPLGNYRSNIRQETYMLLFDLKYKVPVIELVKEDIETAIYIGNEAGDKILRECRVECTDIYFPKIDRLYPYPVVYTYIRADEMFKTVGIEDKFNPEMVKLTNVILN